MANPPPDRREPRGREAHSRPREAAGSRGAAAPDPLLTYTEDLHPSLAGDSFACQRLVSEQAATAPVDPDETLIADPRGNLSPSQMVDRKFLLVAGGGNPGLHVQASGRPGNIRRLPAE
jgi:hypothetical protein